MADREDGPSTLVLYRRANAGEREALEQLLERMRPRLEAWVALRMGPALRARVDAEDLVQEILIKAAGAIGSFQPEGKRAFVKWLFTVARHQISDWQRHYMAAKRDVQREQELRSGIPAQRMGPYSCAERADLMERLLDALTLLPESYRDIVRLRRLEYLDNEEAAGRLGLSREKASVLYVRAMQALRKKMDGP
ncbi:MAG: sigma-70 family RNA polymerase sigma factor [Planctomycetota bacterium]|jgi:RNA polymerase sigma-70 factor (ECF subfamily)